jgi:hypothetical protein
MATASSRCAMAGLSISFRRTATPRRNLTADFPRVSKAQRAAERGSKMIRNIALAARSRLRFARCPLEERNCSVDADTFLYIMEPFR